MTTIDQILFDKSMPEPMSGCWLWMASTNAHGYGLVYFGGNVHKAHRLSWQVHRGPIGDKHVLHKCDTPCCINPDHLWLGTTYDNIQDRHRKKRDNRPIGTRHPCARLIEENVLDVLTRRLRPCEFARLYGVTRGTITSIQTGHSWTHLNRRRPSEQGG